MAVLLFTYFIAFCRVCSHAASAPDTGGVNALCSDIDPQWECMNAGTVGCKTVSNCSIDRGIMRPASVTIWCSALRCGGDCQGYTSNSTTTPPHLMLPPSSPSCWSCRAAWRNKKNGSHIRHKRYCQNHLVTIDHKTDHFWISGLCGWSHKFCMTLDNPFIPSLGLCMVCFMAFSARNSKKDGLKTVSQPLALLRVLHVVDFEQ